MYRLLLISDDPNIIALLPEHLKDILDVSTGSEASVGYHFCLIALESSEATAEMVRGLRLKEGKQERTLVYAYKRDFRQEEQIRCYEAGADDCLEMPIQPEVLRAKLQAAMARLNWQNDSRPTRFETKGMVFDSVEQTLTLHGNTRRLSPKENGIMLLLLRHANQTVNRHIILQEVWKEDSYFSSRSLAVYVHHLRAYLEGSEDAKIMNVPGEGYKMVIGSPIERL